MSGGVDLRGTLVQLRTRVDNHFDSAQRRTPEAFACEAGCHSCCQPGLSVFGLEAELVRESLDDLAERDPATRERVRRQGAELHRERCALLLDGRCAVYEARPLICRSHGLPVVADGELSHCPLNFQGTEIPRESTLALEAVNLPLATLARMAGPAGETRVELRTLARGDEADTRSE